MCTRSFKLPHPFMPLFLALMLTEFLFPLLSFAENYPIFAEQSSSKTSVYVGEQTIYDFSLNTRSALFDFQPPELSLEHAWSETISVNQRARKVINGEVWSSFSTRRAVHPLATGEFIFPALKFPVGVRVKSKRQLGLPAGFEDAFSDQIFADFFAEYERKEVTLSAAEIRITVKPLPDKPKDFVTQQTYIPVGATNVSAQLSKSEISLGESSSFQVTIISTANLNAIKDLALNLPAEIRSYAESGKDEKTENNNALISRKTFRISLVPRAAGTFTIPPIKVGYFDPDRQFYQIAQSHEFKLVVHGSALAQEIKTEASQSTVSQKPTTIATLIPTLSPTPVTLPVWSKLDEKISVESRVYLCVVLIMLCVLITVVLVIRRRSAPFRQAQLLIDTAENLDQLSIRVRVILQKIFAIPTHEYSYEEWVALIKGQPLNAELRFSLLSLIDKLENSRFSQLADPISIDQTQKNETLQVISAILGKR